MKPYESSPDNIPATDMYADVPLYGRYFPRPNDLQVDPQHYWSSVIDLCAESVRIYPADESGRDVFALGSIILKLSHLHEMGDAIAIDRNVLDSIRLTKIYFAGKERLAGVDLNVAFPYLSEDQRLAFKQQAQGILQKLHTIKPDGRQWGRVHVVEDHKILENSRISPLEKEILFSDGNVDPGTINNDKIVDLIDWEMAGLFSWKTAREVHHSIRTSQREHFINAASSEEKLRDIMWWNELYDDSMPESLG
ncbi:hypothetical protein F5Y19DRAFT_463595 [Xylariaceae sp. FL1651]|nr:hypothetical protein F5Y19DRAFT_463595 [Xylariaceae sp. FL1651]